MKTQGAVKAPITCQNLAEMVEPETRQTGMTQESLPETVKIETQGVSRSQIASINQTCGVKCVSQVSKMQALQV